MPPFDVNAHRHAEFPNFKFLVAFDWRVVAGVSKVSAARPSQPQGVPPCSANLADGPSTQALATGVC